MKVKTSNTNQSAWRELTTTAKVPAKLEKLQTLAKNLWWVWNEEATDLFEKIDPATWEASGKNPVLFLSKVNIKRLNEVAKDADFAKEIDSVFKNFKAYMDKKNEASKPSVAYFSMEYGLTDILKIYSGGLGVLAGDYLKEASDSNINMCAVGFLYRYGYFTQSISMDGDQIAVYEPQNFSTLPLEQVKDKDGNPIILEVPYYDRTIYSNIWKVAVGRVDLYLLDTDIEQNPDYDRSITHQLYGGDWENRLKQEYLLGIGGVLMLQKLGIKKDIYHCNEGHAALLNLQRLVDYIEKEGMTFEQAKEVVHASALYTVHTPVPAGHDKFDESLFGRYMYKFAERLGISWDDLMDLGRENPGDKGEKFSMSVFACNLCQESNGVSWLHGEVSKKMFAPIWKGYFPEELHVGYVTNGVHMPTWADRSWKKLFESTFGADYIAKQSKESTWAPINKVDDAKIWETKLALKNRLIDFIKVQYKATWLKNQGDPTQVLAITEKINPNALTIGFGRRFATYKRAHLLFSDLKRLSQIVNNDKAPVQFFFTGKAHPADGGGQGLIKRIIEISRMPEFQGKVIFLENYDMALAKKLISGVDIWLNTPTRPLEASGTSGEKALMNGTINFSVKDGWWYEGYREGAGWALTEHRTYDYQPYQDQLDAATIYNLLEKEIIPKYYATNSKGYSPEWVQTIKNSFMQITPNYTMKRQLDDYVDRFYNKLQKSYDEVSANGYAKAKEIAAWKEKIAAGWDNITIEQANIPEKLLTNPEVGDKNQFDVILNVNGLGDNGIGVDIVISNKNEKGHDKIYKVVEMEMYKQEGTRLFYKANIVIEEA
ncbi:MAG: alpha-glucan family phosphorylase, partial [Paludibacteraceae bacterium]|nr:alpha-glucan family phosphorylase [Paludibacteraceae bacterium]